MYDPWHPFHIHTQNTNANNNSIIWQQFSSLRHVNVVSNHWQHFSFTSHIFCSFSCNPWYLRFCCVASSWHSCYFRMLCYVSPLLPSFLGWKRWDSTGISPPNQALLSVCGIYHAGVYPSLLVPPLSYTHWIFVAQSIQCISGFCVLFWWFYCISWVFDSSDFSDPAVPICLWDRKVFCSCPEYLLSWLQVVQPLQLWSPCLSLVPPDCMCLIWMIF